MTRKLALAAVTAALIFAAVASAPAAYAEWPIPPKPGKQPPPAEKPAIDATRVNGKPVWKVRGIGTVLLYDILSTYSNSADIKAIYYDPRVMPNKECSFVAPESGVEYVGADIGTFVANLLDEHRMALVEHSPGELTVAPVQDAIGKARFVTEAELAGLTPAFHVNCVVRLQRAEPNSVAAAIRGMVRPPSYISPVPGAQALLIGGRASDVAGIVKTVKAFDVTRADALVLKRYEMPEGVDASEVVFAVMKLLPAAPDKGPRPEDEPSFALVKSGFLARATPEDQKFIAEVVALFNPK